MRIQDEISWYVKILDPCNKYLKKKKKTCVGSCHLRITICYPHIIPSKILCTGPENRTLTQTDWLIHTSTNTASVPEVLGREFLVCEDSIEESANNKILVFSTTTARNIILRKSGSYYADGTFRCAPPPFYQMYVLHLDIGSSPKYRNVIPVIYTLLPNKTEETYTRLFRILKQELGIQITTFKCDYELAQINAVQAVFPESQVSGCYHHYNDAIWKNTDKVGLLRTSHGCNIARIAAIIPLVPAQKYQLRGYIF